MDRAFHTWIRLLTCCGSTDLRTWVHQTGGDGSQVYPTSHDQLQAAIDRRLEHLANLDGRCGRMFVACATSD